MKPKEFFLPKEIEDATHSLIEMCRKTESQKDVGKRVISEIANHLSDSYYEVLGILEDAIQEFREVYIQIMDEEEQKDSDKYAGVG